MLLRAILAMLFVAVAGAHVVRTAAVAAFANAQPARAESVWSGHPEVVRSLAMAQVGEAAGAGRAPPPEALRQLEQLARQRPLAAEPYLVEAAIAQRSEDPARAEQLLVQALRLEPRSAAARFLLADLYLRSGQILPGLAQMSVLGRLIPGAMQQVAPSLAAYATSPGAAPHVRQILRTYPELEEGLLGQLAQDPANADLILQIAGPSDSSTEPPLWQRRLLDNLVKEGAFARAYSAWARLSGVEQEGNRGLYNAGFAQSNAPPPRPRLRA